MDYLSLYYKNLTEQLQEKVNHLTQLLEAENRLYPKRFETEEDQYIKDQEDAQKNKVKNSTKQEQSDRLSDDILKGAVIAPGTATGLGALGTIALTGVETALEGSASTEPLAIVGAKALGAVGAGYMAGKAIKAGMDYFDPEQKTYAKIGSVLTGGPEQVERRGAPATQEEYTKAAKTAAAARKVRYGSEVQEKVLILQNEINELYRRTPARDAILNKEKKKAQLDVYAASENHYESGINNDSDYDSDYVYAARDFKKALDHLDRINNITNKTVKKSNQ